MITKTSTAIAIALMALLAAPTASSFAATKKERASGAQAGACLGGGCNATNPDRNRPDYYSSYYKRSSKSKKSSSSK